MLSRMHAEMLVPNMSSKGVTLSISTFKDISCMTMAQQGRGGSDICWGGMSPPWGKSNIRSGIYPHLLLYEPLHIIWHVCESH